MDIYKQVDYKIGIFMRLGKITALFNIPVAADFDL